MSVAIKLPPYWGPLVRGESDLAVHAALDARAPEVAAAIALTAKTSAHVITRRPDRVRAALEDWTGCGRARQIGDALRYDVGGLKVWVSKEPECAATDVDVAICPDAHAYASPPRPQKARRVVLIGEITERGHWFDELTRRSGATRVTGPMIVEAHPRERLLDESDQRYRRLMMLEDVEALKAPFSRFCRDRVRVRTDKGPQFLSPRQQEQAKAQLGPAWASGKAGTPVVSLELTRMQRRYLAMKRRARALGFRKFLLLKYRRGGFTTLEQAQSWELVSQQPRCYVATLAHTDAATRRIFRMVSTFAEHDHDAPSIVGDSKTEIELANGSYFFTGTAGAKGFSRGDTLSRVHGSEVSRWCEGPRKDELMADLMAGIVGAAANGEIVLETTPAGIEWFAQTYRDARKGANDWFPIFLPWFADPTNVMRDGAFDPTEITDTLTAEEREMVERHALTLPQLAFRRRMQREYGRLFRQEWPEDDESCFISSGTCWFDVERVLELLRTVPDGQRTAVPGGFLTVWEAPQPGHRYVVAADPSEGLPGCDPAGAGVLRDDGVQVAKVHGLFRPEVLAEHALRLAVEYNEALLGVERRGYGYAVIKAVMESEHELYHESHLRGGRLFFSGATPASARPGWDTNESTRPVLLNELATAVADGSMVVNDKDFLGECLTFKLQSSGKFEADSGAHDDSVFFWGIANMLRQHRVATPNIFFAQGRV